MAFVPESEQKQRQRALDLQRKVDSSPLSQIITGISSGVTSGVKEFVDAKKLAAKNKAALDVATAKAGGKGGSDKQIADHLKAIKTGKDIIKIDPNDLKTNNPISRDIKRRLESIKNIRSGRGEDSLAVAHARASALKELKDADSAEGDLGGILTPAQREAARPLGVDIGITELDALEATGIAPTGGGPEREAPEPDGSVPQTIDVNKDSRPRTSEGRVIIPNEDGTFSTERTVTMEVDGRHVNIPTMFDGEQVSPEEAMRRIQENGMRDPDTGKPIASFETAEEADVAAKAKTRMLDKEVSHLSGDVPRDGDNAATSMQRKFKREQERKDINEKLAQGRLARVVVKDAPIVNSGTVDFLDQFIPGFKAKVKEGKFSLQTLVDLSKQGEKKAKRIDATKRNANEQVAEATQLIQQFDTVKNSTVELDDFLQATTGKKLGLFTLKMSDLASKSTIITALKQHLSEDNPEFANIVTKVTEFRSLVGGAFSRYQKLITGLTATAEEAERLKLEYADPTGDDLLSIMGKVAGAQRLQEAVIAGAFKSVEAITALENGLGYEYIKSIITGKAPTATNKAIKKEQENIAAKNKKLIEDGNKRKLKKTSKKNKKTIQGLLGGGR